MSRQKKPRNKAHRPSAPCIPMIIRFDSEDERTLQLIPHTALAALKAGNATESDWHTLACRLNVGITMARTLFGQDVAMIMATALASVCDVRDRWKRVGKYGANAQEIKEIGAGLVLADDMQRSSTRREMRDALVHVFKYSAG